MDQGPRHADVRPGSGDGWVRVDEQRVFWGLFGAAGMLLRNVDESGTPWFLLAKRAHWVHRGNGTWAIPGGAIDAHEDPVAAALREYDEEIGRIPSGWQLRGVHEDPVAPGAWSYHTCCADVAERPEYRATLSMENDEARWFSLGELESIRLFEPFRRVLPTLLGIFES